MKTILKTENLTKVYRMGSFPRTVTLQALDGINIAVQSDAPAIISVVGESGSGKTTLAKIILRLVRPTSGELIVADHVVAGAGKQPDQTTFLQTVQPIFQNPFEAFSRYRTIDMYLLETATRVAKLDKRAAIDAVDEALSSVGLEYTDVHGQIPQPVFRRRAPTRLGRTSADSTSKPDRR